MTDAASPRVRKTPVGYGPRLHVDVTRELIDQAEQRDSSHCMIALAVEVAAKAAGFKPQYVAVDIQTIRFTDLERGERYVYLTPRSGQEGIIGFDLGTHVEPFEFRLRNAQVVKAGKRIDHVGRVRLRTAHGESSSRGGGSSVPVRVGGKAPPRMAMRREFGIRGLSR